MEYYFYINVVFILHWDKTKHAIMRVIYRKKNEIVISLNKNKFYFVCTINLKMCTNTIS